MLVQGCRNTLLILISQGKFKDHSPESTNRFLHKELQCGILPAGDPNEVLLIVEQKGFDGRNPQQIVAENYVGKQFPIPHSLHTFVPIEPIIGRFLKLPKMAVVSGELHFHVRRDRLCCEDHIYIY